MATAALLPVEPALTAEPLADFVLVATADVDEGERLRPVDAAWAAALGQIMRREGQRTPIEVCRLPGRTRWTLVAGGHRLAGARSAEIAYLRAEIVGADRDDRRLREVSENLWRRDLQPIDRAAFVAEAVAIHKRRAGIDPARDGRVAGAKMRWQKAVKAEAKDATATIADVYGFTDAVAAELGFSARTVENDLMLYRRLVPSQVERLRKAQHPAAKNATHLRALARFAEADQNRIVDLLVWPGASLNYVQPRTVPEAIAHPLGPKPAGAKPDAEAKRLSAFLGAYSRMGAAERRGALAQLAGLLPAGVTIGGVA